MLEVPLHSLLIFQATRWQEFFLPYLHRNSELLIGLRKVTQLVGGDAKRHTNSWTVCCALCMLSVLGRAALSKRSILNATAPI